MEAPVSWVARRPRLTFIPFGSADACPWCRFPWFPHVTLLPWPPIEARDPRESVFAIRCPTHLL